MEEEEGVDGGRVEGGRVEVVDKMQADWVELDTLTLDGVACLGAELDEADLGGEQENVVELEVTDLATSWCLPSCSLADSGTRDSEAAKHPSNCRETSQSFISLEQRDAFPDEGVTIPLQFSRYSGNDDFKSCKCSVL